MPHIPTPGGAERPGEMPDVARGAALIHVPASAQQDPEAIHACPVCGQPYASESQPVSGQQDEAAASETRAVFRCLHCKTYSVGVLEKASENADD
jgi:hypothetical protein